MADFLLGFSHGPFKPKNAKNLCSCGESPHQTNTRDSKARWICECSRTSGQLQSTSRCCGALKTSKQNVNLPLIFIKLLITQRYAADLLHMFSIVIIVMNKCPASGLSFSSLPSLAWKSNFILECSRNQVTKRWIIGKLGVSTSMNCDRSLWNASMCIGTVLGQQNMRFYKDTSLYKNANWERPHDQGVIHWPAKFCAWRGN